ncbi:hypothetical protein DFH06DRAFT_1297367 [Mycena polygramma]|nr:hypothetical protein DFH06DRAFT_1297367 [Mycena polygramma]
MYVSQLLDREYKTLGTQTIGAVSTILDAGGSYRLQRARNRERADQIGTPRTSQMNGLKAEEFAIYRPQGDVDLPSPTKRDTLRGISCKPPRLRPLDSRSYRLNSQNRSFSASLHKWQIHAWFKVVRHHHHQIRRKLVTAYNRSRSPQSSQSSSAIICSIHENKIYTTIHANDGSYSQKDEAASQEPISKLKSLKVDGERMSNSGSASDSIGDSIAWNLEAELKLVWREERKRDYIEIWKIILKRSWTRNLKPPSAFAAKQYLPLNTLLSVPTKNFYSDKISENKTACLHVCSGWKRSSARTRKAKRLRAVASGCERL